MTPVLWIWSSGAAHRTRIRRFGWTAPDEVREALIMGWRPASALSWATVSLATFFHAIDRRPVWWTGAEPGDRSPGSVVDCDCASGLVSSLVISVVVRRPDRLASHWRSVRLRRSGYMAQAERRCRGARLAGGEYRVLRQSEMYDVGVRPSYDRSVSSDIRPSSGVVLRRAGPCGGR